MNSLTGHTTGAQAYRVLLSMALEYKKFFFLAIAGMVVFALTDAFFAYLIKPMMDDGFIKRDPETIFLIPIVIVGLFMVRMAAVFLRTYCMDFIGRSVINKLRQMMFTKLMTLTTEIYDQSSSGSIITKFAYDVERVAKSVSKSLTVLIQDILRIVVLLIYMIWLSWQLSFIFLVAGPITFLLVVKVSKRFRKISKNIQTSMGHVSHVAQEAIDSNRVVKVFGGQHYETEKFERVNQNNLRQNMKMSVAQAIITPMIQLIVAIAFAFIVAFATSESMQGQISSGDFMSFIVALTMLFAPMRTLSNINASIQEGIAAGESVFEFIEQPSEIDNGKQTLEAASGKIEFKDLQFQYPTSEKPVLEQVSFKVAANQTVAIVGRSGSGKSSLVNLLPRLYELHGGSIKLDGINITDLKLTNLRQQIAYVGQDVRLFNDTMRNNIAYGCAGKVSDEQIIEAAKQAYAWEFISQMDAQLDTMVGERGVLLSGGQRQRLAIARALIKDAPILILDEATSALDTESERHIQRAIEQLMNNRTTLVIAHRLSTIEHADNILVLDKGMLVEQGNHKKLIKQGGLYSALHAMQFSESGIE